MRVAEEHSAAAAGAMFTTALSTRSRELAGER